MFFAVFSLYLENYDRMKLSMDEMILMISPTKVFMESTLLDNSLLVIALEKQKFNKVSDSGSWEPLVYIIQEF